MFVSQPNNLSDSSIVQKQTNLVENIRRTSISDQVLFHRRTSSPAAKTKVQIIYDQLHNYIDKVEEKVKHIIDTQSNQYKIVYHHYYKIFKDQLHQLKTKTLQQERTFEDDDRVRFLATQIKMLKEQSIRYKNSYEKIKQQNQQSKATLQMYRDDITLLKNMNKTYLKQIKLLNSHKSILESQPITETITENPPNSPKKHLSSQFSDKKYDQIGIEQLHCPVMIQKSAFTHKYSYTELNHRRPRNKDNGKKDQQTIQNELKENKNSFRCNIAHSSKHKHEIINQNWFSKDIASFRTQIQVKAQQSYTTFNICQWFIQCVRSVNKSIFHRKYKSNSHQTNRISKFYTQLSSLDQFLKNDKTQVLRIFLSNPKILTLIYNLLKSQKNADQEKCMGLEQITQNSKEKQTVQKDKQQNQIPLKIALKYTSNDILKEGQSQRLNFSKTMLNMISCKRKSHSLSKQTAVSFKKQRNHTLSTTLKQQHSLRNQIQLSLIIQKDKQRTDPHTEQGPDEGKNLNLLEKLSSRVKQRKNIQLSFQLYKRKKNFVTQNCSKIDVI